MTKHSPGPWWVNQQPSYHPQVLAGPFKGGTAIADLFDERDPNGPNGYEETQANARLIAAAPDLLAAAKVAAEYLDMIGYTPTADGRLRTIADAIAKAEGA